MQNAINWLQEHRWPALMILAPILFVYALICHVLPLANNVLSLARDLRVSRQQIEQVSEWEIKSRQLQHEKTNLNRKIESLVYSQSRDNQLSRILTILHTAAKEQDIALQAIKPQPIKTYERHVELPIQLEMTTHFHPLAHFINNLETSPTVIKVDKVKMSSLNLASSILHVQMTVVVHFVTSTASSVKPATNK